MDQYSQHKLKIAATEPEHLVRKAELDAMVGHPSDLLTWNKSSLVNSVNEIHDRLDN